MRAVLLVALVAILFVVAQATSVEFRRHNRKQRQQVQPAVETESDSALLGLIAGVIGRVAVRAGTKIAVEKAKEKFFNKSDIAVFTKSLRVQPAVESDRAYRTMIKKHRQPAVETESDSELLGLVAGVIGRAALRAGANYAVQKGVEKFFNKADRVVIAKPGARILPVPGTKHIMRTQVRAAVETESDSELLGLVAGIIGRAALRAGANYAVGKAKEKFFNKADRVVLAKHIMRIIPVRRPAVETESDSEFFGLIAGVIGRAALKAGAKYAIGKAKEKFSNKSDRAFIAQGARIRPVFTESDSELLGLVAGIIGRAALRAGASYAVDKAKEKFFNKSDRAFLAKHIMRLQIRPVVETESDSEFMGLIAGVIGRAALKAGASYAVDKVKQKFFNKSDEELSDAEFLGLIRGIVNQGKMSASKITKDKREMTQSDSSIPCAHCKVLRGETYNKCLRTCVH